MKFNQFFPAFVLSCLLAVSPLYAVSPTYEKYTWESSPKLHELSAEEKKLPEIVLKEKQSSEFVLKDNDLIQYDLFHKIVKVNSDNSIEENNRLYLPAGSRITFLSLKARVIKPNGKVVELNEKDVKEGVDEKSNQAYKYFALEGLEIGSEIEILFFISKNPSYTGTVEVIQSDVLKKNVEFDVISPSHLVFQFKSFNGLPEFKQDTTNEEKNVMYIKVDKVEALKKEDMSAYRANLQQFIYKLYENTEAGNRNIVSYSKVSGNIYQMIMAPVAPALEKKVKKLVQQVNLKYARDEEDKVRTVELYIKQNFGVVKGSSDALDDLNMVIDKKIASEEGIMKLYAAIFNYLKIDFQVVLTCDRDRLKFDPKFEAYVYLSEYLLYFPAFSKYLSPVDPLSCLGFAPHNLMNNHGLFIKKVMVGTYSSGVGKVQFIDPLPYDKTYHHLLVNVDFSKDIEKPKVNAVQEYGGYYAQHYQPFFSFLTDEDKEKIKQQIAESYIENLEGVDVTVENGGMEYFGINPFIVKMNFEYENLMEHAGDNYLFKAGELIGRQMEMYEKEERRMPVENDFNRKYHREITFTIPEGYRLANPEVLKMDVFFEDKNERILAFTSNYTIEGSKVKVEIDEYYKRIMIPLENFGSFRKVINAAADFNKITLLFEKKK